MLRLCMVDPGADWATRDVYEGLFHGLKYHGIKAIDFNYGRRLAVMGKALHLAWHEVQKANPKSPHPTHGDAARYAGDLAVSVALGWQANWLIVSCGMYFHPDSLIIARRAGLRIAVHLTESPYDYEAEARFAQLSDLVWTNERTAVAPLQESAPNAIVRYLPHAFHPERHTPGVHEHDEEVPAHDVVFVGTGFQERVELLSAIDWTGIDFGLYGTFPTLGSRHPLRKHLRSHNKPIDNVVASALYRRAKVGLNLYRTSKGFGRKAPRVVGAESCNPRAYELAATGCVQLSEYRPEVRDVFGDAVVTFDSPQDAGGKIRDLLANDIRRAKLSKRAIDASAGHSWIRRSEQFIADLDYANARLDARGCRVCGQTMPAPAIVADTPGQDAPSAL